MGSDNKGSDMGLRHQEMRPRMVLAIEMGSRVLAEGLGGYIEVVAAGQGGAMASDKARRPRRRR